MPKDTVRIRLNFAKPCKLVVELPNFLADFKLVEIEIMVSGDLGVELNFGWGSTSKDETLETTV